MPARTSPEPAVASQGGALALIARRPSGAAIDGVGALEDDDGARAGGGCAGALGLGGFGEVGEEAGELAVVRRQDHRRGRAARRRRAPRGRRRQRQGVGVEDRGGRAASAAARRARSRRAGAEAGAERDRGEAGVVEEGGELLGGRRRGRSITAVRCAALIASASPGLARVTRPAPARSAAPAARRAAPVRVMRPETTRAWPRRYLWSSGRGGRKRRARGPACSRRRAGRCPRGRCRGCRCRRASARPQRARPG